ncbi:MAG TPA: DNA polymerase Y family protein, partial [Amaricoccus sp.]|nr:DNA polymerase Y family protein [Amaricoccus sp.]
MPSRRILSLWFPRLAAERVLRLEPGLGLGLGGRPLAVVREARGALVLASLSAAAEAAGLRRGMALGDARAICPALLTRPEDPGAETTFLLALRRWAERFSPLVATEGREGLVLDVTGCAHLFGGEAGMVARIEAEAGDLGLSLGAGLADTLGAAWAVARYAGVGSGPVHAGDAIDQEARATRSRAARRSRGGQAPEPAGGPGRVAPPGGALARIGPLPVAALRLEPEEVEALQALGLRRIVDLVRVPRAAIARRAGPGVLRRLDQALGTLAEPVAALRPPPVFAVRLTLPEPIGLEADVLAGIDRLLPPLCARLAGAGRAARRVRLTLVRTDGRAERREVGLARPATRPEAIRRLLALGLGEIDAGFGIERLRLEAVEVEPVETGKPLGRREKRRQESQGFADL